MTVHVRGKKHCKIVSSYRDTQPVNRFITMSASRSVVTPLVSDKIEPALVNLFRLTQKWLLIDMMVKIV